MLLNGRYSVSHKHIMDTDTNNKGDACLGGKFHISQHYCILDLCSNSRFNFSAEDVVSFNQVIPTVASTLNFKIIAICITRTSKLTVMEHALKIRH